MKAPLIKLNGKLYPVNCLDFYNGELFTLSYKNESGDMVILYGYETDLDSLLEEGEQHERVS
jgi:hypothetical protein